MVRILLLALVLLCAGCAPKTEVPAEPVDKSQPVARNAKAVMLSGPGGTVAIGDALEDAKKAFPAPKDAEVFEKSEFFSALGADGWTWGHGMGTGFEAGIKEGKIIALAYTRLDGPVGGGAVSEQRSSLGEPTRMADGKTATMMVWEDGSNARFFVVFKGGNPFFGAGSLTVIGDKEQLKLLNYRHDDPDTFVKQMDGTVDQLKEQEKKSK